MKGSVGGGIGRWSGKGAALKEGGGASGGYACWKVG